MDYTEDVLSPRGPPKIKFGKKPGPLSFTNKGIVPRPSRLPPLPMGDKFTIEANPAEADNTYIMRYNVKVVQWQAKEMHLGCCNPKRKLYWNLLKIKIKRKEEREKFALFCSKTKLRLIPF